MKFEDEDDSEHLSQYFIAVEQKLMLECSTLIAALFFGMVAHYVFNLEYHSKVKGVWLFLQEKVFQLPTDKNGKHSPSCIVHVTGISRVHAKMCESDAMECDEQIDQSLEDNDLP